VKELLDCTFRDGGYYTNWTFDKQMVHDTVHALDQTKQVHYIEIGYKSPSKGGPYKKCNEEYIRSVLQKRPTAKLSFMIDLKEFINNDKLDTTLLNDMIAHTKFSWFKMVRIACTKANIHHVNECVDILHNKKYIIGVNLMQVALLEKKDYYECIEVLKLSKNKVDYFYIADSFGTIRPKHMGFYRDTFKVLGKIGFHAHDNMGLAYANVLQASHWHIYDTTVTGMGRGVGNAKTEQYLSTFSNTDITGLHHVIDKYFEPLKAKHGWGWNKHYMQTAVQKIHPTYAQNLINSHQSDANITKILSTIQKRTYDPSLIETYLKPKVCVVIPARYQSSRFPGKPLQPLLGRPMISHVADTAIKVVGRDNVYVATENNEIRQVCKQLNLNVIMTSDECLTGTDRVAEAAVELGYDFIVNIQGDEPLIKQQDIQKAIDAKIKHKNKVINCFTSVYEKEALSPNTIKMVMKENGELMYASRSAIPGTKTGIGDDLYKQVCIYVFTKEELELYSGRNKSPVEWFEDIEILRYVEMNYPVHMVKVSSSSHAVDTPQDVEIVEELLLA